MRICGRGLSNASRHESRDEAVQVPFVDTYADLFPDDLEIVAAALDDARRGALERPRESTAD